MKIGNSLSNAFHEMQSSQSADETRAVFDIDTSDWMMKIFLFFIQ